jgi:hypothetical protein
MYLESMTTTRTKRAAFLVPAIIAAGSLTLAACGGSSDGGATTTAAPTPTQTDEPGGGGAAECTTEALEKATQDAAAAAGVTLENTNEYDCVDGWAIVFGVTKANDIEQTTAFVFEAEGQFWVPVSTSEICDGDVDGVPSAIKDQACALR